MVTWLVLLAVFGIGGLLLQVQELSLLVVFAGIFISAQAADVDPRWFALYAVLGFVIPIGGAVTFGMLAVNIAKGSTTGMLRIVAAGFSALAAAFSLLTLYRPLANAMARALFRSGESRTLRLAARVACLALLVVFPAVVAMRDVLEPVLERPGGVFQPAALGGELIGYVLMALAAVGFLVRRDLRQTLERLGLGPLRPRHLGLIAAGAGALFALNSGAEWVQHHLFPAGWEHDRRINEEMVRGLSVRAAILLGMTAGIGEEITIRGALQPRLGIFLTSLVFAALHVQYSWFGMLTILLIGIVLGMVRQRAGTTVSIAIHAIYDVMAVFAT
jgi:hypothetical protein